jgi:cytochrome P450
MPFAFDPRDSRLFDDPRPIFGRLRDERPAYHDAQRKPWALSRLEHAWQALRDPATFSSGRGIAILDERHAADRTESTRGERPCRAESSLRRSEDRTLRSA